MFPVANSRLHTSLVFSFMYNLADCDYDVDHKEIHHPVECELLGNSPMEKANFEDGQKASVALQTAIMGLLNDGLDPRSVGLMASSIGIAMLMDHFGKEAGHEICQGLVQKSMNGELATYPALRAANQNVKTNGD